SNRTPPCPHAAGALLAVKKVTIGEWAPRIVHLTQREPHKQLSQMRRGAVEYCVLALLRHEDRYALELAKELTKVELVAGEGTLYPLFARLRGEHLVETYWEESPVGPPRRYYRITKKGERVVDEFVAQWKTFRDAVDTVLGVRRR